jgi:hypothetical protein
MKSPPTFLDFEASSLSPHSYPIEVAWSLEDGSIESHLISPAGVDGWTDWDSAAERLHGIPRRKLLAEGEPPLLVCNRMNEQLAGKVVYTDALRFDGMWLAKLLYACDDAAPEFKLRHVDELLGTMICPGAQGHTSDLIKIEALKREARKRKPRRHRASWDVEYLRELWRLASFEAKVG